MLNIVCIVVIGPIMFKLTTKSARNDDTIVGVEHINHWASLFDTSMASSHNVVKTCNDIVATNTDRARLR